MMKLIRFLPLSALAFVAGCSVNEVITADETELIVASAPKAERQLLDVGVVEFDPGIPADNNPDKTRIYEPIRNAEARYLAYHLKNTMQGTGHWGAVRVLPAPEAYTDVTVRARIEESDGEFVKLDVTVTDTAGSTWFSRDYETQTGVSSYSENRDRREDPYQKVFNDIANDVHEHSKTLSPDYIERLQQISELRFFADMSPLAYGDHLTTDDDGNVTVNRLPAENDPAVDRLRQIRERDRLVVDMLNEHYANFYYGIAIPYQAFRKASRAEAINYRQVKRSAALKTLMGVVVLAGSMSMDTGDSSYSQRRMKRTLQTIGISEGFNAIVAGYTRNKEAAIHVEAIEELAESFSSEAAPMVVNVQGETRRLTGTAAAQYEAWRKLLREIYKAETGFTESVEVGERTQLDEPAG